MTEISLSIVENNMGIKQSENINKDRAEDAIKNVHPWPASGFWQSGARRVAHPVFGVSQTFWPRNSRVPPSHRETNSINFSCDAPE